MHRRSRELAGLMLAGSLALAGCGSGADDRRPTVRYAAVSPTGELLAAPTPDADRYRAAMLAWFDAADSNRDGTLDSAELAADATRAFALYDQNTDGNVTSAELTAYRVASPYRTMPVEGGGRIRPGRLNMNASEADTEGRDSRGRVQFRLGVDPVMAADANADFRVTLAEFLDLMGRRLAQMDKDGDGRVSRAEFLSFAEGPMRAWQQD